MLAYGVSPNSCRPDISFGKDFVAGKVTESNQTALHTACRLGWLSCSVMLVLCGVDIKAVDGGGKTAMQIAEEVGHPSIVSYLQRKLIVLGS